ncbi:unnamed protein product [Linum trigynum]|uniref:Uncharacterized protein n=1 Tax=Linum trigynum TaxID=586398 RepID=A0AAV2FU09_9ROSI
MNSRLPVSPSLSTNTPNSISSQINIAARILPRTVEVVVVVQSGRTQHLRLSEQSWSSEFQIQVSPVRKQEGEAVEPGVSMLILPLREAHSRPSTSPPSRSIDVDSATSLRLRSDADAPNVSQLA